MFLLTLLASGLSAIAGGTISVISAVPVVGSTLASGIAVGSGTVGTAVTAGVVKSGAGIVTATSLGSIAASSTTIAASGVMIEKGHKALK